MRDFVLLYIIGITVAEKDTVCLYFEYKNGNIMHIDLKNITNKKSYIGHEFSKLKYEQKILFIVEDFNVCIRVYNYNELSKNEIDKIVLRICCMIRSFKDRIEKNDINIYIYIYNCSRIITETYINSPIEFKTLINE